MHLACAAAGRTMPIYMPVAIVSIVFAASWALRGASREQQIVPRKPCFPTVVLLFANYSGLSPCLFRTVGSSSRESSYRGFCGVYTVLCQLTFQTVLNAVRWGRGEQLSVSIRGRTKAKRSPKELKANAARGTGAVWSTDGQRT